jgi:putative ABC transport system substrate-binding protein
MRRREFIALFGGVAVGWPLAARAQQPDRMRTVGVLSNSVETNPTVQSQVSAFRSALTKLGWTQGTNLRIELRWGAGDPDRIATLAKNSSICGGCDLWF